MAIFAHYRTILEDTAWVFYGQTQIEAKHLVSYTITQHVYAITSTRLYEKENLYVVFLINICRLSCKQWLSQNLFLGSLASADRKCDLSHHKPSNANGSRFIVHYILQHPLHPQARVLSCAFSLLEG